VVTSHYDCTPKADDFIPLLLADGMQKLLLLLFLVEMVEFPVEVNNFTVLCVHQ
jgi:hypothetical protein